MEGIRLVIETQRKNGFIGSDDYIASLIYNNLHSQGVVIRVKCPDCAWSQFQHESAGMAPCYTCDSTGYLIEPLIKEGNMRIYLKQVVFCPRTNQEQDGNNCASCEFYNSHEVESERQFIDCKFDK